MYHNVYILYLFITSRKTQKIGTFDKMHTRNQLVITN